MARLTVKQCKFCPIGKENCDYFKSLKSEVDPIAKGFAFSHNCKKFWTLFEEGDRVEVDTALAYEKVEELGDYATYTSIDTTRVSCKGTIIGRICRDGKALVCLDDNDKAMDIIRSQIEEKVGFYGKMFMDGGAYRTDAFIENYGPAFRVFVRDLKKI